MFKVTEPVRGSDAVLGIAGSRAEARVKDEFPYIESLRLAREAGGGYIIVIDGPIPRDRQRIQKIVAEEVERATPQGA